ncbi:MAG: hypothetical protein OXC54_06160 [Rhodospirillaceae bacterium]|nr:hypothetical protein [Rhodospirillaceae bacterium]
MPGGAELPGALTMAIVSVVSDSVLRRSKTDQEGEGAVVAVTPQAMAELDRLAALRGGDPDPAAPMFGLSADFPADRGRRGSPVLPLRCGPAPDHARTNGVQLKLSALIGNEEPDLSQNYGRVWNYPRWLSKSLEALSSLDNPKGFRVSPSQNRSDARSKSMIIFLDCPLVRRRMFL